MSEESKPTFKDDPRSTLELSQAGCKCVRYGEGNPHWPCHIHGDWEREAFEAWAKSTPQGSQLRYVRDALPVTDQRYGEYVSEALRLGWEAWQARAALSPAGGGVVMPKYKENRTLHDVDESYQDGWNNCLDEFARLNAKPQANSQECQP